MSPQRSGDGCEIGLCTKKWRLSINIKPTQNRVLIKKDPVEEEIGGIFVSSGIKKNQGTVVAVGPGRVINGILVPNLLNVDDVVLLPEYGGVDIKRDGVDYVIMYDSDVSASLEAED